MAKIVYKKMTHPVESIEITCVFNQRDKLTFHHFEANSLRVSLEERGRFSHIRFSKSDAKVLAQVLNDWVEGKF
jgi:hypothetical protein